MPLFSLPVNANDLRPSSRARLYFQSSKKRKRSSSSGQFAEEFESLELDREPESSSLPAASTNPLSLGPDEIRQYRVAGLSFDQELPSKTIPEFPHRSLPSHFDSTSHRDARHHVSDDEDSEAEEKVASRPMKSPHLRIQHLAVLTTILHRCLLDGDIPRGSRAWAMLLRAQINGKEIDIRTSGYWGIGAELLIRSADRPLQGRKNSQDNQNEEPTSSAEDDAHPVNEEEPDDKEQRWGTAAGLEKAKEYYERLILQHPYKRYFQNSVNSLDFWPAMLGCEIYGIQFEQKEALRKIATAKGNKENTSDDSSEGESVKDDPEEYLADQERREALKQERQLDKSWHKRDQVRQTALAATEKVAARMDELMTSLPFSDSHVLNKLRGMLALYIGDLSVPALLKEEDSDEGEEDMKDSRRSTDRRLLERQRRAEHERGLLKQSTERARARKAFEKARKHGGKISVELDRFGSEDID